MEELQCPENINERDDTPTNLPGTDRNGRKKTREIFSTYK